MIGKKREMHQSHPAVHAYLPCRKRQRIGFGCPAESFPDADGLHLSYGGILESDADNQGQRIVQHPASGQQATSERDGHEPCEAFADQVGQRAAGSAVEGREHRPLP